MKQSIEVIVDYPTLTAGQFQCKLKQTFECDSSVEVNFNSLFAALKLIFGDKSIITFRMF